MAEPDLEPLRLRCSIGGFGNCDPICGLHKESPSETECQALSACLKPIQRHLSTVKVSTKDLQFEWQLILCRVGKFDLIESECPAHLTVCPKHRAELGIRWKIKRSTCQHPMHKPTSKAKPDRGINFEMSKDIFLQEHMLVPLGSGMCQICRKLPKRQKVEDAPNTVVDEQPSQHHDIVPESVPSTSQATQMEVRGDEQQVESQQILTVPREPLFSMPSVPSPSRSLQEEVKGMSSSEDTASMTSDEQQVSLWLPSPQSNLPILNRFMSSVSSGRVSPIRAQLHTPLEDVAPSTKRYYKRKAQQAIDLALECISPNNTESLKLCIQTNTPEYDEKESLLHLYEACDSWFTKKQILSVFVNSYTKQQLQDMIPGLTKWRIDEARKHAALIGPGELVVMKPVTRSRLDFTKVDHFIDFISSPLFLQDVAFGTKRLKLSNGEKMEIPGVVRTVIASRLINLYNAYCEESSFEPLGKSTLFSIIQQCSASQKKSVSGLDNIAADGMEGFDLLENIAQTLHHSGKQKEWLNSLVSKLHRCKRYLKTDFAIHLSSNSQVPDHCMPFALSSGEKAFSLSCDHNHEAGCERCNEVQDVITELELTLLQLIPSNDERSEELKFELERAQVNIFKWKSHILRGVQQDKAKSDLLDKLDRTQALITMDWAMKFLPVNFRETQEGWFGKKGKSWHVTAVITKGENGEFEVLCLVHIFEQVAQGWFAVASIIENSLEQLHEHMPAIKTVFLRSDNAGCYHTSYLLSTIPGISRRTGINIQRYDFSEPQKGKDICDRKIAVMKSHIHKYINEGHNVTNASEMKEALDSYGGVAGCLASVVVLDESRKGTGKCTWAGIQGFNNFHFSDEGIQVWKSYEIGEGTLSRELSFEQEHTGLITVQKFPSHVEATTIRQRRVRQQTTRQAAPQHDVEDGKGFSCPEPCCIKVYTTFSGLQRHLDSGRHLLKAQEENPSDYVKKKWAEVCTSVSSTSACSLSGSSSGQLSYVNAGWASKASRKSARFGENVREHLLELFREGERTGNKADAAKTAADMKKNKQFRREDWLTTQQVKSYFSRLTALYRGGKLLQQEEDDIVPLIEENFRSKLREKIQENVDL